MTRTQRIALGIATAWPFVWVVAFFASVLGIAFWGVSGAHGPKDQVMPWMVGLLIAGHIFTILLIFALIAIYLVILFRMNYVPEDKKALWAVVIILGGFIGCAIFWFLYIRPQRDDVPQAGVGMA